MNTSKENLKNGSRDREWGISGFIRVVDVGEDWRYPRIAERSEGSERSERITKKSKRLYSGATPK